MAGTQSADWQAVRNDRHGMPAVTVCANAAGPGGCHILAADRYVDVRPAGHPRYRASPSQMPVRKCTSRIVKSEASARH
jgi:hypothetical protein